MSTKVKRSVIIASCVLTFIGFAQVLNAFSLAGISAGTLGGGWWVGISALFTGIRGLRIHNDMTYRYVSIGATITLILAIAATAVLALEFSFYDSIEACSSYTSSGQGDCNLFANVTIPSINTTVVYKNETYHFYKNASVVYESVFDDYDCYGNSEYYKGAAYCEYLSQSSQCSCVTTSSLNEDDDSYTCYEFNSLSSCDVIFGSINQSLQAAYALSLITLFSALFVMLVTATAVYRPYYLDSDLTATTATVVRSNNQPQIGIVVTSDSYVYNPSSDIIVQPAVPTQSTVYNPTHSSSTTGKDTGVVLGTVVH